MTGIMKVWMVLSVVVGGALAYAPTASAQGLGRRYELGELKQLVSDAKLVVRAKATAEPVSRGGDAAGYVWDVPFDVVEVIKGEYSGQQFTLELKSPLGDLNTGRKQMPEKEFVLPLAAAGQGRFRLVGDVGFAADSEEAKKLIEIAGGKIVSTSVPAEVTSPLRLRVDAVRPPYEAGKPVLVRVALENASTDLVTYEQAPFEVREGRLYLPGDGNLIVTDSRRSLSVPMKENVSLKSNPPLPATPVSLIAQGRYEKEIDLAEFFDLSQPGLYMVMMAVTGPDGKELIRSNTAGVQVIAPLVSSTKVSVSDVPPTDDSLVIPAPEAYRAGEMENGLAGLLRPTKAQFEVGEPVTVELRLTNMGDRAFSVDTRLERALALEVRPEGNSPAAREHSQYFSWPSTKDGEVQYVYSRLRPRSFWGKEVNVNSLFGLSRAKMEENARAVQKGAVEPTYETSGLTLFAFEKPGVYRIRATYEMAPSGNEGPKLWAGKLTTNPIFIRVVAGARSEKPVEDSE